MVPVPGTEVSVSTGSGGPRSRLSRPTTPPLSRVAKCPGLEMLSPDPDGFNHRALLALCRSFNAGFAPIVLDSGFLTIRESLSLASRPKPQMIVTNLGDPVMAKLTLPRATDHHHIRR
jgi:hypothetical protein